MCIRDRYTPGDDWDVYHLLGLWTDADTSQQMTRRNANGTTDSIVGHQMCIRDRVSIHRKLPSTITVNIKEYKLRAYVPYMGSYLYINDYGRILE